ncbi:hypothetical protein E6O75_ATG03553 [Venturia nashicola]|uniref:Uncharacterized protein n=1 Tax=Venturia nashicola TaxID=86259 RepID=A0A4Z1PP69_9PEZI|nr:hypothetical protein E6O75_ATG03553 [Venturia nashicola]
MFMIILLLFLYDSKPVFEWHGASLNSFVSVFATISKTLLLMAVSSCLGQWKYIYFYREKRKLIEFDVFDGASRGPEGSFHLLWHIRFRSLAVIGALITIFALAFDPFVQQIIGIEELQTEGKFNSTAVPRAMRYSEGVMYDIKATGYQVNKSYYAAIISKSSFSMQASILSGLTSDITRIAQQVPVRCPSGHCQWKPYKSLAVCSRCSNVTKSLKNSTVIYTTKDPYTFPFVLFMDDNPSSAFTAGSVSTLALPNGLYVDIGYSPAALTCGTNNRSKTISFMDEESLIWSTSMIKQVGSSHNYAATECVLYYCVKEFRSQFINGTLLETSEMVSLAQSPDSWRPLDESLPDPSPGTLDTHVEYLRNDLQFGKDYRLSQAAINGIGGQIASVFSLSKAILNATGYYVDREHFSPAVMQPLFESSNLSNTFEALAYSMTNVMRVNDDNSTTVEGTAGVVVYHIRWVWICLPLGVVLGGCLFLILTISHQRNCGLAIWKTSSLAVLKCGAAIGSHMQDSKFIGDMEDKASKTQIAPFGSVIVEFGRTLQTMDAADSCRSLVGANVAD